MLVQWCYAFIQPTLFSLDWKRFGCVQKKRSPRAKGQRGAPSTVRVWLHSKLFGWLPSTKVIDVRVNKWRKFIKNIWYNVTLVVPKSFIQDFARFQTCTKVSSRFIVSSSWVSNRSKSELSFSQVANRFVLGLTTEVKFIQRRKPSVKPSL